MQHQQGKKFELKDEQQVTSSSRQLRQVRFDIECCVPNFNIYLINHSLKTTIAQNSKDLKICLALWLYSCNNIVLIFSIYSLHHQIHHQQRSKQLSTNQLIISIIISSCAVSSCCSSQLHILLCIHGDWKLCNHRVPAPNPLSGMAG